MKKKIILLLLATSLVLPKDFLIHAIGFPALIAHFIHHHNHHAHISFTTFLALHDEDAVHHDSEQHDKLPCHHHHSSDCFQPNNTLAQLQFTEFNLHCFTSIKSTPCVYNEAWISSYTVNFWQPPKLG